MARTVATLLLSGCLLAAPGGARAGEAPATRVVQVPMAMMAMETGRLAAPGGAGPLVLVAAAVSGEIEAIEEEDREAQRVDPWEGLNRPIFAFNETLDRWVLEPVAIGWDFVLPDPVETCIGNFFDNLGLPIHFANDVLQAKPLEAYETLWRAVINTTVGIGGLFDPASAWTVHESDEDFGQTLGRWGTPPGPYLVLPLFGPSSPRDATGRVVDSFGAAYTYFVPFYVPIAASAVDLVNTRAGAIEEIRAERAAAFDFYVAVRSAYTQYRENQVRDRAEDARDEAEEEDLYFFDEEDEGYAPEDDDDV